MIRIHLSAILVSAVVLAGCGGSSSSAAPQAGGPSPARSSSCVDVRAATEVWKDVNRRLNAVTRSADHGGLDGAATGAAAALLRQYIDAQLIAKKLTEREQDRLDSLTVTDGGCSGGPLVVEVRETLVGDDYIAADGHVDHADAKVGTASHFQNTYVRAGSTWKLSDLQDLDAPGPSAPSTTV